MEFLHKAESVAQMVALVATLEGPEGPSVQDSFFQERDSSALSGIISNMQRGGDAEGVAQALWVLVRLCRRAMSKNTACEANLDMIGSESCLKSVFQNLKDNRECLSNANVALACSWLIMVLASDSVERQERLAKPDIGTLEVLAALMGHFKGTTDYPKVTEFLTRACRNLASHDEVAHQLVEAGVCENLTDIIRCYTDLLVSIDRTSPRLDRGELLLTSETDIDDGGQSTVLVAYDVIEAAMWASLNLTCDVNIAQIYASVQGLSVVLEAIKVLSMTYARRDMRTQLSADAVLPSEAAVAVALLVLRNLTTQGAYAYTLLLNAPVITTLFDCMRAYPASFDVNDPALFTIVNLTEERNMAARLMDADVASLLVCTASALSVNYRKLEDTQIETRDQRHFRTGPIAEAAIWATRHLAGYSRANALLLGKKGMIDILVSFLNEYKHKDGMVQSICECLATLTFTMRQTEEEQSKPIMKNITRLVNAGGLKLIVAALKQHSGPIMSQLSEMHDSAMILLAKNAEEMNRYLSMALPEPDADANANADGDEGEDEDSKPNAREVSSARVLMADMQVRDATDNVFVPIIDTMKEHPVNGDLARCGCQLLLDLYYTSTEEKELLQEKGLVDMKVGKASMGGATLEEVCLVWGADEIRDKWGPPKKEKAQKKQVIEGEEGGRET